MSLNYIAIRVKDADESRAFYEKLGLKFLGEHSFVPGERVQRMVDEKTGQRINLMYYAEDCRLYTPWKEDGVELDHLSFEFDDPKKVYDEFVASGAPVAWEFQERETPKGKFGGGFIKDPNGIWVGIVKLPKNPNEIITSGSQS